MFWVNNSSNTLHLENNGIQYMIKPWQHIRLPDEMDNYILALSIPLDPDYDLIISKGQNEI
mgnify:CR=1 FL=1